jgi:hypothetical protein
MVQRRKVKQFLLLCSKALEDKTAFTHRFKDLATESGAAQ